MRTKTERWRSPEAVTFLAALGCGFITHLFGLVNVLHNYDDIWIQPMGYGSGVEIGRWMLTLMGDVVNWFGGGFILTVVNGILFILFVAVTAAFVVNIFKVENRVSAVLIGMLFVVFPAMTSVMFFRYTTVYYGIALLESVLAVWILNRHKYGWVISTILIAVSMGIYQAYVSITIGLFVMLLIQETLKGKSNLVIMIRRGILDCVVLILGLLLYFLCLKCVLACYGETLTDYQGVNAMGQIELYQLPRLIWQAFSSFCKMPIYDYCALANSKLLKLSYLCLAGLSAVILVYLLIVKVRKINLIVFTGLLCLVFPIAVNFVVIMAPDCNTYTIMVYSFVLVGCLPLILMECVPEEFWKTWKVLCKKGIFLATGVIILSYGYYANVEYTAQYFANRQVENYVSAMVTQVRMTEGFTAEKQWAFLGEIDDPLLESPWEDAMCYGGNRYTEYLVNTYSRSAWFKNYVGYTLPMASEEKVLALWEMEEVKEMPCWPDQGSIRVVGDTVVIKCQESAQIEE